ncbi:hypothetical protein KSP39_PZI003358 [Platanthera zijinensis]|uniref:Uncharacterized protein n=1 Tax=Platanthera zijinensis TaxID=2320716 RepID=A0AAP0BUK7_9ASPA
MSTVSASSYDLSSALKRKRGRPRKDETSGSESNRRVLRTPHSNVNLVGREVYGSFVGVFDTGYLLTVQVSDSGPVMSGLVFDPRLSVPISSENDIAPHLPMLQRNDCSSPFEEDFLNRGALSPQAYVALKTRMEMTPSDCSHVLPSAGETVEPAKTFKIFLEGSAAETSKHLDSQVKVEDTPITAELLNVSKPSYPTFKPSVVSPMSTSLEASKGVPEDKSKISNEPSNIPKEAVPGLPFKISPSAVFKPSEASAQNTHPHEQKSPAASRQDETVETMGIDGKKLSSHGPSVDRKTDDFLAVGAESRTAAAEKLEDDLTVPEASTFQP